MSIKNNVGVALKGFGMGAANVVPGVSGGTIALLCGIFGELIDALNAFITPSTWKTLFRGDFRGFLDKIHGKFLFWLFIGILLSVFTLAKLVTWTLRLYPVQTWAFFFGLIAASALCMLRDIRGWQAKDILFTVAGIALGLLTSTLSPAETPDSMWFIALCGAIAVCTMILPGISGSFILVILGKYDFIMQAVGSMDIPVICVFAAGAVAGILAFSKFLHWLLARFERQTMLILIGFVIGTLVKVWPWSDMAAVSAANNLTATPGAMHIPAAIICAVAGAAFVLILELRSGKKA